VASAMIFSVRMLASFRAYETKLARKRAWT